MSILNRFSCNFAGIICSYNGDSLENLVKFEQRLQKLRMRLMWNLIQYFKSYSFRRKFSRHFLIDFPVILQALSAATTATALNI